MTCPVYTRLTTTPSEQQEWQNASLRDSEKFICQSEREQVLDELNDWIHSFNFISVSSCPTIFDVLEKIAELRTPTEAHR